MSSDLELRQDVLDELEFEPSVNAAHIGVTANHGVVTLTGFVTNYAEKTMAERAARAVDILKWQVGFPADRIKVKVEKGMVTLSGEVDWQFQKTDAYHVVHKLSGVIGVLNQIEVAAPLHAIEVKEKIEKAFQRSAELEASRITVETEGGRVTLKGKVHAWYERDMAERAAWSAPGVTEVLDRLTIEP